MKEKVKIFNKDFIIDVVKSTLIATIASLIGVLILALIVKFVSIGENVIFPINQVIKIGSILIGCLAGIKHRENGAIKGAVTGLFYTLLSVFVFLIINKTLDGNSFNYIDFVSGIIAGTVSGIIAVNFKKK